MCAWPAARRVKCWRTGYHRPRLDSGSHHGVCVVCGARGSLGELAGSIGWENVKDQLSWWWEKVLTCRMGRHHAKMDSWPFCYRCGKRVGTMRRLCVYCGTPIDEAPVRHKDWCSRNMRGEFEPTFNADTCSCLADGDPAPDAHLEGCRAWAVWR